MRVAYKKYIPFIGAVTVAAFAMAGFIFLGSVEKKRSLLAYRSYVHSLLDASGEKIQNIMNSSMTSVEGLSAYVSIHPRLSAVEFNEFAKRIIDKHKNIHSIELVRDTTVTSYIYPLKGNEKAAGVDLMSLPDDRETVQRAVSSKETVIAGPLTLIQGGTAFISRSPIFVASGKKSQKEKYWGLAQSIISAEVVFKEAGLYDISSVLSLAVRGRDAKGGNGEIFFGDKAVFQSNPVVADVMLFNGSWQMAVVPKEGWDSISGASPAMRLTRPAISVLLGFLVFVYLRSRFASMESEEKSKAFERLFSEVPDLAYILDTDGNLLFANKVFEELSGCKLKEFTGKPFAPLFDEENLGRAMVVYKNILNGETAHFELTFRYTEKTCEYKSFPIFDETGKVKEVMGIARDITERKKAEEQIRQTAYFDSLTGLASRALFNDRIEQAIARAQRFRQWLAVLYLDLDDFKIINDTLGHKAGDAALKETACRLRSCLREMDTAARIGGDEFVFILEDMRCREDAAFVAEKIIVAMSEPVLLNGNTYILGCSIGIAIYPDDATDSETLISNADTAMYMAKADGGNNFRFYNEGVQDGAMRI